MASVRIRASMVHMSKVSAARGRTVCSERVTTASRPTTATPVIPRKATFPARSGFRQRNPARIKRRACSSQKAACPWGDAV